MSNNQNLYDNIINATVVNMFSFSKDGKIIIKNTKSEDLVRRSYEILDDM